MKRQFKRKKEEQEDEFTFETLSPFDNIVRYFSEFYNAQKSPQQQKHAAVLRRSYSTGKDVERE